MIHNKFRYLLTLVALFAMTAGAWAADTYTITFSGFGNEACNKTVTDATLEYSETFNVTDVYADYTMLGGVGGSNEYVSISKSQDEKQITITVKSAFEGTVNVTVYYMNENYDESERNISVTCVKSTPAITVEWNAATNTGTFNQPGGDVVLTPIYAPAAQWATEGNEVLTPTAIEGVIAGTTDAIVKAGTVATGQGTAMYFATTDATMTAEKAATANGWLSTLPTAAGYDDATTVYVWYYIAGADTPDGQEATDKNTFNDSEICAQPLEVSVLSNKFDITFNALNANTIDATQASKGTVSVKVGTGAAVDMTSAITDEGKLEAIKMGSEVKLKANNGYKFRKVEVKKGDAAPATVLSGALVDGAIIKVNFKWRMENSGDYVQGVYNAASGTFTASKGGYDWNDDERAVYKVEKSGDNIIIGACFNNFSDGEAMVWTFNTTNDTYTTTNGSTVNAQPGWYGLISVTLNGTDITSQLTAQ